MFKTIHLTGISMFIIIIIIVLERIVFHKMLHWIHWIVLVVRRGRGVHLWAEPPGLPGVDHVTQLPGGGGLQELPPLLRRQVLQSDPSLSSHSSAVIDKCVSLLGRCNT
jgi:hypothetical protein